MSRRAAFSGGCGRILCLLGLVGLLVVPGAGLPGPEHSTASSVSSSASPGARAEPSRSAHSSSDAAGDYAVTFTESGLPTGATWFVNVTGGGSFDSDRTTATFSEPNGSYAYTLASTNKSYAGPAGEFSVSGGDVTRSVAFTEVVYTVTIQESSLPAGTRWYVNLTSGPTLSSTTDTITTSLPNGSYAYNASVIGAHWVPDPYEGTFEVAGASPASPEFTYVYAYAVTFDRPAGSTSGSGWGVTVTGPGALDLVVAPDASAGFGGAGSTLLFYEPNGTYSYVALVSSDSDYSGTGSFVVKDSAVTVVPPGVPAGQLPPYDLYGVVVGAVIVLAAIAAVLVFRRRPRGPTPTVPPDGITGGPTPSPAPASTDGAPAPEAPGGS